MLFDIGNFCGKLHRPVSKFACRLLCNLLAGAMLTIMIPGYTDVDASDILELLVCVIKVSAVV